MYFFFFQNFQKIIKVMSPQIFILIYLTINLLQTLCQDYHYNCYCCLYHDYYHDFGNYLLYYNNNSDFCIKTAQSDKQKRRIKHRLKQNSTLEHKKWYNFELRNIRRCVHMAVIMEPSI
jgi:hypothetical protein